MIRRYEFYAFDGTLAGRVKDTNQRAITYVCGVFAAQITGAWSGYVHYCGTSQRVYAVAIAPGQFPWCKLVQTRNGLVYQRREKRRTPAEAKAAIPQTILDDVRNSLPIAGHTFWPKPIADQLGVHVNVVLGELRVLQDHKRVVQVVPKLRHGAKTPVLAELAWQVVSTVAA